MVEVSPIRTEQDYETALAEVASLIAARPGTPQGDRLDVLVTLVQAYEAEHHAIEAPDPIALVQFAMEQRGLDRAALRPLIGDRGRVSEVMARKRPLTLAMIRRLHDGLGLPADALVQPYPLDRSEAA
ncbi:MAG TPA: transcriptional regulator [Allosphingosinicella sp.]|nr:transcriptional regulator [Allosphingosinicella sp.]